MSEIKTKNNKIIFIIYKNNNIDAPQDLVRCRIYDKLIITVPFPAGLGDKVSVWSDVPMSSEAKARPRKLKTFESSEYVSSSLKSTSERNKKKNGRHDEDEEEDDDDQQLTIEIEFNRGGNFTYWIETESEGSSKLSCGSKGWISVDPLVVLGLQGGGRGEENILPIDSFVTLTMITR